MKNGKNPFSVVNRIGMKLTILFAIIILVSEILTFTATIVIGFLTGGTSNTVQVVVSVAASFLVGSTLAFVISNTVLKPLSELVKATRKVTNGDFNIHLEMKYSRLSLKELRELIHDFNEMTEELRNTELFRKDFISNFSHEFKTPLVSIRGFARQLYEGGLTPEQQKEFSKIILDETEYLSVLSQNTLLMTNLENKDIITEKTDFSLDEQLRNCMIRLEPQWLAKNIDIDMELDEIRYYWNASMLAHVWNNLFDNAVKFTPEGGSIRVTLGRKDGLIVATVTDSGCGISEEAIPHIFEKFYQADTSHATKGNGLGLSLVKKIVELCEGDIYVSSEVGKGTTFTIELRDRK